MSAPKRKPTGIYEVHSRKCATRKSPDARCNCTPTWQAYVPPPRPGDPPIRKNFKKQADAKRWRQDAQVAVRRGELKTPSKTRVKEAADALVIGMKDGSIRDRSGKPYKPATIRSYQRALKLRVVPELGRYRLTDLRRRDVQALVDGLVRDGMSASSIKNTLDPLRVIYRRAINRDEATVDPTKGLEVPRDRGRRDRFATPDEAAALIAALPEPQQALWATAVYTGMRRGELRELRWSDLDLDANVVRVERALDDSGEVIDVKTDAGHRVIPILAALRPYLVRHKLLTGRDADALVFGRTARDAFTPSTVRRHAIDAWTAAKLQPIALHECRHSTASFMRAAGLDFKVISALIGHSSVVITFERYTHLSDDDLRRAAETLDAHVAQAARAGLR